MQHVTCMRMQRARHLLETTQETVESIAREVGFSRAFKRWIGSSARADTDNNGVDDLLDFALGSRGAPTAASDGVGGSSRSRSNATPLLRHPSRWSVLPTSSPPHGSPQMPPCSAAHRSAARWND
jgi:hypothetical protein